MIVLTTDALPQATKSKEIMKNRPYPFEINDHDGHYSMTAQIESAELFNNYNALFGRNGYSGNGYCWEGHIIQILEKIDKGLLDHIDFDSEAGAFYAYADSESTQRRFINILSPIFADLEKLEEYLKSADRNRIDD